MYREKTYPRHRTALTVDHLDGNIVNNIPDNLVPSCARCNVAWNAYQPPAGLLRVGQIADLAQVTRGVVHYGRRVGLLVDRGRVPGGSWLFAAEDVRQWLARRRAAASGLMVASVCVVAMPHHHREGKASRKPLRPGHRPPTGSRITTRLRARREHDVPFEDSLGVSLTTPLVVGG